MRQELDTLETLDPADVEEMREVETSPEESPWVDVGLEERPRDPETEVELEAPEDVLQTAGPSRPTRLPSDGGGKTVEDQSLAAAMEVIDRFHQYQRLRERATGRTSGSPPPATRSANTPAPPAPASRRRR